MVTPATSPTATDTPPHSSRHHIRALPSLPGTIRRILELLADPEVTAEQLERGLLMDPVIVQQYIAGREIAVAFVSDEVLPLSEIDFSTMPEDHWPIVTFEAKWSPNSPDYKGTVPVCPADIDNHLRDRIVTIASDAWKTVRGHSYGRVDFRIDDEGSPWLLEVNPNPDSSPDAGLANMAMAHGWTYDELVMRILAEAFVATQPAGAPSG